MKLDLQATRQRQEIEPRAQLRIPRPIDVAQLQTTASVVFTADSNADFQIENLTAANTTSTADYVTVYMVPSGGSAGATNLMIYQKAVPAKDYVVLFDASHFGMLQPGWTLEALCGVNDAINIWGHGFDYQGAYS